MTSTIAAEKACTKCGETKPFDAFSRDASKRDGRASHCADCNARRVREAKWKKAGIPESDFPRKHRDYEYVKEMRGIMERLDIKRCHVCWRSKPRSEFSADASQSDGLRSRCRDCDAAAKGEWYAENRDRDRERKAQYYAENRERRREDAARWAREHRDKCRAAAARYRARKAGLPDDGTTESDWIAFHNEYFDDWTCHLCECSFRRGDEIAFDHIDPIDGGSAGTVVENMRAAHASCNSAKGNRT